MLENVFRNLGVEIGLKNPEDFLKIKETLTRIGISSKKEQKLYQSCHILHKRGRYAILHFKEMFVLDGKDSDITDEDTARRNTITNLLAEWKLIEIIDKDKCEDPISQIKTIKIISHADKKNWILSAKYTIGKK